MRPLSTKQRRILAYLSGASAPVTRKEMEATCKQKGYSEALGSPTTEIRPESLEGRGLVRRLDNTPPFHYVITASGRDTANDLQSGESYRASNGAHAAPQGARITPESDESAYPEGVESYRLHRHLERDPTLSKRAKAERLQATGHLECEACGFDFSETYGILGTGFIEAHHTLPVAAMKGSHKTKVSELALVCSNCHRMLHRGTRLLTIQELRSLLQPGKT